MCKKQTAVSHSSKESEIISLDTGLRLDGLPALELWDLIATKAMAALKPFFGHMCARYLSAQKDMKSAYSRHERRT